MKVKQAIWSYFLFVILSGCKVTLLGKQTDSQGWEIKVTHYVNRANHIVEMVVRDGKQLKEYYTLYDDGDKYFIKKMFYANQADSVKWYRAVTASTPGTCQFFNYIYPATSCAGLLPHKLVPLSSRDSFLITVMFGELNKKGYTLFQVYDIPKILGWLPPPDQY